MQALKIQCRPFAKPRPP